jgi:Phage major capsid protein E
MPTIPQLKWTSLTKAVNLIQSPNQFLKRNVFKNHVTLNTEVVEIDQFTASRVAAPFVRKNGEAILVGGVNENFNVVEATNIRLKRPFTPSELLFNRRPGITVFPEDGDIQQAINQHIALDMQNIANLITNAEEYLCTNAMQGEITYSVSDAEVFTVNFNLPAANSVTLAVFWDDPVTDAPTPEEDFLAMKRIVAQGPAQLAITDVVMSQTAATGFLSTIRKQKLLLLQGLGVEVGLPTLNNDFNTQDGVVFLGTFCNVRVWEYSRTVTLNGVTTSIIPSGYAMFFCNSEAAENVLYYGAIPDLATFGALPIKSERFSKAWINEDPSVYYCLVHSRPVPVPRKISSIVIAKVTST